MPVRRRAALVAAAAAVTLSVTACTDADDEPGPPASPEPSPSVTSESSGTPKSPAASTSGPVGGTADAPAPVDPVTDLADWQPLPGSTEDTVTTNGDWTLTVNRNRTRYQLDGPSSGSGSAGMSDRRYRVSDAFLDERWAVVVFSDTQETEPAQAQVTELASGATFSIDGGSDVPTISGGSWAFGHDLLAHAAVPADGGYCLASVELQSRRSTLGWCAEPQHGFNAVRISEAGTSLLTFDNASPSCRTVAVVEGTAIEPFPGVTECKGWEGVLTQDGAVWSVVPKENRVEAAQVYARVGEGYFDLGPGTSGTLVPCAGAAFFVRDPQQDGEPARLMRWDGSTLAVVYESPAGQAFLDTPRCGGNSINISAFAESGDEQVWAGAGGAS